jgi:hypothetical protein
MQLVGFIKGEGSEERANPQSLSECLLELSSGVETGLANQSRECNWHSGRALSAALSKVSVRQVGI